MRHEDSMTKIAEDILRDRKADARARASGKRWHDEYATLRFFRFVCKRIGNLGEGEMNRLARRLKEADHRAVENHEPGAVWAFDYDKMFSALTEHPVCRKVCEKNKYRCWMDLVSRYCVDDDPEWEVEYEAEEE